MVVCAKIKAIKCRPFENDLLWQVLRELSKTHIPALALALEPEGLKQFAASQVCRSEHVGMHTVSLLHDLYKTYKEGYL